MVYPAVRDVVGGFVVEDCVEGGGDLVGLMLICAWKGGRDGGPYADAADIEEQDFGALL